MPNSSQTDKLIRYHVVVSGKVQGVGYRKSVLQFAQCLNLSGWVQNLPDGRVEAIFEGSATDIEEMLRCCRQGNPMAVVVEIAIKEETPESIQSFEIRH